VLNQGGLDADADTDTPNEFTTTSTCAMNQN
jgi:hypothetical protein